MSAETLRRAANKMREDHRHDLDSEATTFVAVAAWLDEVAERQKPTERWGRRSHGWTGARRANEVARAYLGESA